MESCEIFILYKHDITFLTYCDVAITLNAHMHGPGAPSPHPNPGSVADTVCILRSNRLPSSLFVLDVFFWCIFVLLLQDTLGEEAASEIPLVDHCKYKYAVPSVARHHYIQFYHTLSLPSLPVHSSMLPVVRIVYGPPLLNCIHLYCPEVSGYVGK